jgi:hypothetical protein
MHGLTGGDWKRSRDQRKPRQSPTLPIEGLTWCSAGGLLQTGLFTHGRKQSASWPMAGIDWVCDVSASRLNGQQVK